MFCFVAAWETRVQLGEIFVKGAVSESGGTGEKLEHLLASKRSGSARCSVLWWPVAGCQLCVRKCWLFRLMCSCSIRLWCTSPVSLCCVYRYFPAVDWGGRGILSWCAFFFSSKEVSMRGPLWCECQWSKNCWSSPIRPPRGTVNGGVFCGSVPPKAYKELLLFP